MKIITEKKGTIEKKAVKIIVEILNKTIEKKGIAILGIPGGQSIQGIFKLLKNTKIQWDKIHIFMIDERCTSLNSKDSNFKKAKDLFLNNLINNGTLPVKNVHPFNYKENIEKYSKKFLELTQKFDLILLGVGDDSHIASIFPNHPSSIDQSKYFIHVENAPKPPSIRMSASLNLIKKSENAIILFFGESKKDAYDKFINTKQSINKQPVQVVKSIQNLYILRDC